MDREERGGLWPVGPLPHAARPRRRGRDRAASGRCTLRTAVSSVRTIVRAGVRLRPAWPRRATVRRRPASSEPLVADQVAADAAPAPRSCAPSAIAGRRRAATRRSRQPRAAARGFARAGRGRRPRPRTVVHQPLAQLGRRLDLLDRGRQHARPRRAASVPRAWQAAHVAQVQLELARLLDVEGVEQVGGELLFVAAVVVVAHSKPLRQLDLESSPSPSRIRPFTVPSGMSSVSAISEWVRPAEVGELDHAHLVVRAARSARRAPAARLAAKRLRVRLLTALAASPASPRRSVSVGACSTSRRSRSIARLRTMPEQPRAHAAARSVIARTASPQREESLLGDVLGGGALADHPVGERVRRSAVAVVDDLERRPSPCARRAASGPRRRGAEGRGRSS